MPIELGQIEALFRYPIKSMRGELLDTAELGWHGIPGDRRLALRRVGERAGMPWLTASKLPELVRFTPRFEPSSSPVATHVELPDGPTLPIGDELAAEIGRRFGAPVEFMHLRHGIFDETPISVITSATARELCRLAGVPESIGRFRPNIVIRSLAAVPLEENDWVGAMLEIGDARLSVMMRDERCAMVNIDPETAATNPAVMKAVVRANGNDAGVYASVARIGPLAVGQTVILRR